MDADERTSQKKRWLWIGAVVAMLALAGEWQAYSSKSRAADSKTGKDEPVPVVTVIKPSSGAAHSVIEVTGTLSARNEIPVGPEGESGRIAEVFAEAGQRVRRGQTLARLDPTVAEAQVAAMQASLEELKASAAVAEAEHARAQRAHDAFSVEESERRRTTAVTAQAKVRVAEAQLNEARTRWTHTRIVAPADGLVLTRNAEVGQIVVPGNSVLFKIAQGDEIELRGQVAEQDVPLLSIGQAVELRLNGVARVYRGNVWQIGAIIDSTTRQGTVRIKLAERDANLRPGAFARANVQVADVPGLVVPQTAVLADDDGEYALVVGAQQKLERRAVKVRGVHPQGVVIESGLNPSDEVVSTAGAFLRAGETVKAIMASSAAPPSAAASLSGSSPAKPVAH